MSSKWLSLINFLLAGLAIALLIFSGGMYLLGKWSINVDETPPPQKHLPQHGFKRPDSQYQEIAPPFLNLKFAPISLQLPDLRRYLVYYGRNERPDADPEHPLLYFGFAGSKEPPIAVHPNKKIYLIYSKGKPHGGYQFSPDDRETSLWIEAKPKGKDALVTTGMLNDQGKPITEPKQHAEFTLAPKEYIRSRTTPWMIGNTRVDGTLLARQRARWWGEDLFMNEHGGEEYKDYIGKQRIDFGEKENKYSIYLGKGDVAIWDGDRWKVMKPGPKTREYPLLVVKKIDERILHLELWDVGGDAKIPINLIKSTQAWVTQNIEQQFKFVGARTRSQFVFEVKGERLLLQPHDWLLYANNEWKKLTTAQEIDDYVNLKTPGVLFIFEGIGRKEGQPVLLGTMYSPNRSMVKQVELPVQQAAAPFSPQKDAEDQEDAKELKHHATDFTPPDRE